MTTALDLRLYIKPGCHLCEDAEAEIEAIGTLYPYSLECIDINSDAELTRRYWDQIPVLVIDGREYPAPLSRSVIERALNDAAARAGISPSKPGAGSSPNARTASGPGSNGGGDTAGEGARRYPWSGWLGR
jgi:hypothetical protein